MKPDSSTLLILLWSFFPTQSRSDGKLSKTRFLALGTLNFSVYFLSRVWLGQVTKYVAEPYLDEFFHIPQAQVYCAGNYFHWDQKITTPPGLYTFSIVLSQVLQRGACAVYDLRAGNSVALYLLFRVVLGCRQFITGGKITHQGGTAWSGRPSWNAIHTAINIALFPPLFFFSGLYYTDVVSTCVVVFSYYTFLQRKSEARAWLGFFGSYAVGVIAIFMRQTNIFWVAVFLAGLEWVRACKGLRMSTTQVAGRSEPDDGIQEIITAYTRGEVHDPILSVAGITDLFWCVLSVGVAAIAHPILVVARLWPYVALLASFAGFVYWNGGVVLGDKSNHIATIHLPQMLYIWPFLAFFSAPLIYPPVITILNSVLGAGQKKETAYRRVTPLGQAPLSLVTVLWLLLSTGVSVAVIHFNTIIHPFTLADNRHFVFYVFRYTIRQHPYVKYALAPIYVVCGWLAFKCLAGPPPPTVPTTALERAMQPGSAKKRKAKVQGTPVGTIQDGAAAEPIGTNTSFTLVWILATTLSLITAPLVEPRYFIIPWVIWRLHVPSLPLASSKVIDRSGFRYWAYKGHDHRLWFETIWFLAINMVTGYVFLFKGFEWPQEPGKVQRFMW